MSQQSVWEVDNVQRDLRDWIYGVKEGSRGLDIFIAQWILGWRIEMEKVFSETEGYQDSYVIYTPDGLKIAPTDSAIFRPTIITDEYNAWSWAIKNTSFPSVSTNLNHTIATLLPITYTEDDEPFFRLWRKENGRWYASFDPDTENEGEWHNEYADPHNAFSAKPEDLQEQPALAIVRAWWVWQARNEELNEDAVKVILRLSESEESNPD